MSKTERLSHYAIMLVAVSALVVSVWQVRISQEHNKLSVKPYLDFFSGWGEDGLWQLKLSNEGVGPAIIKSVDYNFKGKTYSSWDTLLEEAGLRLLRTNSTNFDKNSPFAVEKSVVFLELNRKEEALRSTLNINVVIHYESIYEEPFELKMSF